MSSFLDLIVDLPLEILCLIVEKCSPNDLVCLRLASKRFYNVVPSVVSVSNGTPTHQEKILLTQTDFKHLCGSSVAWSDWQGRQMHRYQCHFLSKAEDQRRKALEEGGDPSEIVAEVQRTVGRPGIRACKVRAYKDHCECFNQPLWKRLEGWMRHSKGQDFRYCSRCNMFTKRKRWHNGRCYHGGRKPQRQRHEFWTYKKGGGGYRWKERKGRFK